MAVAKKALDWDGLSYYHGKIMDKLDEINQRIEELSSAGGGGGIVVSNTAPEDTSVLWIDTGNGGIAKYYDTSSSKWVTVKSVFG